jgi:hypothetical protein
MNITFTNTSGLDDLQEPKPASKLIPEWYVKMESYTKEKKKPRGDGQSSGTIKRCMPVFDAITAGYIIESPADVYVSIKDGHQYFEWAFFELIGFHPIQQAEIHPFAKPYDYPKWINHWAIKTPKGYSTLFVQPFHRESVFTILPGVVDTDEYFAPINFPMVINDPKFEGLIPKGTPIAQVIPFKRDSWQIAFGGMQEIQEQKRLSNKIQHTFFDRYKNMFRAHKEYK